jgi:hypothetical protein
MKKLLIAALVLGPAMLTPVETALAQKETATGVDVEKDIALLRRNLRSEKKKFIAANLPLTETEATKFWPVYDRYADEMKKHNDGFYELIKEYAANQKTLTDSQATSMLKRWADIQVQVAQTRVKFIPLVEAVLPGRKAAHFFQIDRRLYALMDVQTSAEIPLIVPQQ